MPSAPGTTKVVTFTVTDEDQELVDPSSVVAKFGLVDTEPTTIDPGDVERVSLGVYRIECPCPTSGDWGARLEAFDAGAAMIGAFERYWHIAPSRLQVPA